MNNNYIVQYLINLGGNVEQKIHAIEVLSERGLRGIKVT